MDQAKKKEPKKDQVIVKGKWVEKELFRAWIYGHDGAAKIAESHLEYEKELASGKWFSEPPVVSQKVRKQKDDDSDS